MAVFTAAASIGAAVLGAFGVTAAWATGVTFATMAVGFLSQAAIGIALNALTPKPKIRGANRGYQVTTRGSALDHQIIYGRMRVGGVIVYDKTTGNNNKFLHRVIAFAGHEVESFDEVYINDEVLHVANINGEGFTYEVAYNYENGQDSITEFFSSTTEFNEQLYTGGTTPTAQEVASDLGVPDAGDVFFLTVGDKIPAGEVIAPDKYVGKIRVNKHLGAPDQAADSDLEDEDPSWTPQHRLRGIAYLYIRLKFDQDAFPNGVPDITATIKGKKVYDPRTDTTEWSDNPALCLRDYLSESYGLAEADANIDDTIVSTAADVCDETDTVSGEKRYTCNGAFITQVTPIEILNDMLTSMGGLLWYAQGEWRMKPAYYVAPTLTFTEDDLRSSIAVKTRHSRRDNFNTVKGTFRGEESNWQVTDYPEVTNSAFVAADNGQESVLDLELPFTDNADEARRIARIVLERNRQQLTVSASFGLRAFQVQTGDIIKLSIDRFGWTQKEFEVTSWTFGLTDGQDLQVQMTLREISESVFDEVDDGIVYERDNTTLPSPFITVAPENLTVSDGGFTTEDGTFVNSFIVDWDAPDDAFVDYYVLEWRVQGDSKFKSVQLESTEFQISPITENVTYDIRVKAVNVLGVSGPYATITAQVGGDSVAPSLPTSITATGGFRYITIEWTSPPEADLNYVEVWENATNTTVGASLVGEVWGSQFVRTNLGIDETRFYFLRSVDFSGNTSGYTSGVSATTTFLDDPDFENGIRSLFEDQGLYPIEDVDTLPPSGILNRKVFNRADGKLYEWDGSAWVLVIASAETDDLIGQITETQITDGAISTPKLQAGAVTATEIAGSTITGDKIVANTITGGLLATSGIITNSAQINDALITNAKIEDAAVTNAKIGNAAITTAKIDNLSVGTAKIKNGAVTNRFASFTAGSVSLTSSYQLLQSVSIDCDGNPVSVLFNAGVDGATSVEIDVRVDGTSQRVFDTSSGFFVNPNGFNGTAFVSISGSTGVGGDGLHSHSFSGGDFAQVSITAATQFFEIMSTTALTINPSAGSKTVEVYARLNGGFSDSPAVRNRYLETTELKR